jgi:hypothetical protein
MLLGLPYFPKVIIDAWLLVALLEEGRRKQCFWDEKYLEEKDGPY